MKTKKLVIYVKYPNENDWIYYTKIQVPGDLDVELCKLVGKGCLYSSSRNNDYKFVIEYQETIYVNTKKHPNVG